MLSMKRLTMIFLLYTIFSQTNALATTFKILSPQSGTRVSLGDRVVVKWEIDGLPADSSDLSLVITGNPNNLYPKNGVAQYEWSVEHLPKSLDIFNDSEGKQAIQLELTETKMDDCPPDADCIGEKKVLGKGQVDLIVSLPKVIDGKSCRGLGPERNKEFPHESRLLRCANNLHKITSKDEASSLIKECKQRGDGFRFILCLDGRYWEPTLD